MRPPYDVVVLAGARSERLGGADKPMVTVGGASMLERVLSALDDAEHVAVVGPERALTLGRPVTWCEEQPPGGGPVAAAAAGLEAGGVADVVLLLAADLPFVAGGLTALRHALDGGADVAALVDESGRVNYLASAWHRETIVRRLRQLGDPAGRSMRSLLADLDVAHVADPAGWGVDCDTWETIEQARATADDRRRDDRATT